MMAESPDIHSSLGGQEQFIADLADIQEYLSYMTQLILDSQAEADSEDYFMRQFADEYLQALKLKERQLAGIRIYLRRLELQNRTDAEPMYSLIRDLMNDVEPKCRQVVQSLTRIRDGRSGLSATGSRLYVTTSPPIVEVQGSLLCKETAETTSPSDDGRPISVDGVAVSGTSDTTSVKVIDSTPIVPAGKVVADKVDNAVSALAAGVTGLTVSSPTASSPDSDQSNSDSSDAKDDKTPVAGVAASSSPAQQQKNIAQQQQQLAQDVLEKQQQQLIQQQQQQLAQFAKDAQKPNGSPQTKPAVQPSTPAGSGSNAAVSPGSRAGQSLQQQPPVTPPTPLPRQQQQQPRPRQPTAQHQQPAPVQTSQQQQQQPPPATSPGQQLPQQQIPPTQSPRQLSPRQQTSPTQSPRQPSPTQQSPQQHQVSPLQSSTRNRQLLKPSSNTTQPVNTTPSVDNGKSHQSILEDWAEGVKQLKEKGVTKLRIDRKRPDFLQAVCEFYESNRDRELRRDFEVIFEGEEIAVDRGALSREFFFISFENSITGLFKGCKLMIGERGHLLPDATLDHLVHAFKVLGIMTAHAVKSGCHGLPGLSPAVKYYLIHGSGLAFIEDLQPPVTIDDVSDEQLHNILFKLNNIENLTDTENAALLEWMDRSNCRMRLDLGTRMLIVQTLLIYYVFKMRIRQIDAFAEGLEAFGLRHFLRENPSEKNISMVFPEEVNVTPEMFLATVINRGDEFDIKTWDFFQEFLRELHSRNIDNMDIPDLVRFLSGSPHLPSRVVVSFSRKAVLPVAHACFQEIELPMLHDNYSSFREAMMKGLECTEFAMG